MATSALPQCKEDVLNTNTTRFVQSFEGQPDATTANAPPPAAAAASGIQIQQDNMQQAPISVMTTPNGAANVIPTSPRYGVAISVALATEPTVTPAIVSSINKIEEDGSSSRTTTDRFKVVKIASLEPFKRGRWKCMDYVDEAPPPNVSKASTQTNNIQGAVYMQSQSLPQQQIHQMLLQGTQFYPNISQLIPQGQYFYPANPQQQPMPNNNNNNQFINTQPYFVAANMNPSTGFTLPQNYPNIQYVPIPAQNSAFVSTTQHFQQSQTYAGQATQPGLMNGHHITYPQQNEPQILPSQPAESVTSNNNPPIQHQPFQPPQPQTYHQPAPAAQNIIQPQNVDSSATNNGPPNPQLATLTALDDETGSSAINVEDPSTKSNPVNAIDNKIEQAMDLVKSHLMYTVREEVEVLKEKIAELMERIQQLETENNYLKSQIPKNAMASPGSSNNAAFQQQPNIAIVNPSPSFVTQQTINDYSTTNDHQSDKDSVQVQ